MFCHADQLAAEWASPEYAEELYSHAGDDSSSFDGWEDANLAEQKPEVAEYLRHKLHRFFSDAGHRRVGERP